MRTTINELRRIIRTVILESEERVYDDTVLPGEEADDELLAEPDLTDQEERDDYIQSKEEMRSKKKRVRRTGQEAQTRLAHTGDEHAIVGAIGPLGAGNGPGRNPYRKQKKLKSRNAMGSRPLDEYDE